LILNDQTLQNYANPRRRVNADRTAFGVAIGEAGVADATQACRTRRRRRITSTAVPGSTWRD
jgi:hypothetical protein